jgi:hypothetical protein
MNFNMIDNLKTEKAGETSYHKILAMILVVIFSLIVAFTLFMFISIIVGMNKYGGEMADGFGLIMIFAFLIHLTIFLIWSYRIFKPAWIKYH